MNNSKQTDLMAMDVTWSLEDLELHDNRIGVGEATIFTISKTIVLAMGIIAQRTFYKMMRRLPGRVINQILYPHMVRPIHIIDTKGQKVPKKPSRAEDFSKKRTDGFIFFFCREEQLCSEVKRHLFIFGKIYGAAGTPICF